MCRKSYLVSNSEPHVTLCWKFAEMWFTIANWKFNRGIFDIKKKSAKSWIAAWVNPIPSGITKHWYLFKIKWSYCLSNNSYYFLFKHFTNFSFRNEVTRQGFFNVRFGGSSGWQPAWYQPHLNAKFLPAQCEPQEPATTGSRDPRTWVAECLVRKASCCIDWWKVYCWYQLGQGENQKFVLFELWAQIN